MTNSSNPESRLPKLSSSTRELISTLPRVWTRGLLYLLILFAAVAVPWALFTCVDQTGSAKGRLEPVGRTIRLDAPVTEALIKINVKEGQVVKAGETLAEFQTKPVLAEQQGVEAKLNGQQQQRRQLTQTNKQAEAAILIRQQQNQAEQAEQQGQMAQTLDRLASSQYNYPLEQKQAQLIQKNVERYQFLLREGAVPKIKLEEFEGQWLKSQQQLDQAASRIRQTKIDMERQQKAYDRILRAGELAVLEHQTKQQETATQITQLSSEIAQTQKQVESLELQLQQRVIKAPVDGTVFQLDVHHAGTVLQTGQMIAQIAPNDMPLILRAKMPTSESGFLQDKLQHQTHNEPPIVRLKFDAYPFQDYGVVEGHLRWISPDSKEVETAQGKVEMFELEIEIDQPYISVQGKQIKLTAGETATAEVIIRQRRIIDILLDPFKKLQQGGLEL